MLNGLLQFAAALSLAITMFPVTSLAETKDVCVRDFCVQTVTDGNDVAVFGINKSAHIPYSISFDLTLKNMDVFPEKDRRRFQVAAGQKSLLFVLRGKEGSGWSYKYEFNTLNGNIFAEHDKDFLYRIPIARNTTAYVSQSCNGAFSHVGASKYAIDFTIKTGTPIHAARGGRVISVKEDSNRSGKTRDFINDGNEIKILHEDGTIGFYVHLKQYGALVEPGDYVRKGEKIGLSGNTGWSTAPHLHFEVFTISDKFETYSVPIKFSSSKGVVSCVEKGTISPG